jgi:hypothetical protein
MKITAQDYSVLLQAAHSLKEAYPQFTPASYATAGLGKDPAMRFRWDMSYGLKKFLPPNFIVDILYTYMNDSHLDTALKRIVAEVF